jgi:RimJ/RimL family protein N-acetyltransferase
MTPLLIDVPTEFDSARLILRAWRPGDGGELNTAVVESLDALKPWMPWAQAAPTAKESEEFCRRAHIRFLAREDLAFGLFLKGAGTLIGSSGLHRMDWNVPKFEIGYWLRTSFTGRGYMTEAVAAITGFAFETLHAKRVEIRADDRNERSWRIPERLGFRLEGVLHNDGRDAAGALRHTRVYARVTSE